MSPRSVIALTAAAGLAAALGACTPPPTASISADQHGRYAGVGIYTPGPGWSELVKAQPQQALPGASAQARNADDQVVIVVVDSQTGELRACGDLSGYCVGMNPWTHAPQQTAPALLTPPAKPAG